MACQDHSIYVLLTDTGTLFTRTIKLYTGIQWNHASISFDDTLRETYSFGRKCAWNPISAGFVKEDVAGPLFRKASCMLLRCPVTKRQYDRIRQTVLLMEAEKHRYKYNLLGIVGLLLNREWEREDAYFCTQFIASLFGSAGIRLSDKRPSLVTPGDILRAPVLEPVYSGPLQPLAAGGHEAAGAREAEPALAM